MMRTLLWPCVVTDCYPLGSVSVKSVRVLDLHELADGKTAALLARNATRSVFDCHALLGTKELDVAKLRLGFVVYDGINRKDWRTVSIGDVVL